jgi:hypothetical protein
LYPERKRVLWQLLLVLFFMPRIYKTLDGALSSFNMASGNVDFIRAFCDGIAISHYEIPDSNPYIKAHRTDGKRDLRIYFGYTGGFESPDEIHSVAGAKVDIWPHGGYFSVGHPVTGTSAWGPPKPQRPVTFCGRCNMALPDNGRCDCGD